MSCSLRISFIKKYFNGGGHFIGDFIEDTCDICNREYIDCNDLVTSTTGIPIIVSTIIVCEMCAVHFMLKKIIK